MRAMVLQKEKGKKSSAAKYATETLDKHVRTIENMSVVPTVRRSDNTAGDRSAPRVYDSYTVSSSFVTSSPLSMV
jgi:hypothetical protein